MRIPRFDFYIDLKAATWPLKKESPNGGWVEYSKVADLVCLLRKAEAERDAQKARAEDWQHAAMIAAESSRKAKEELAEIQQQKPLAVFDGYEDGDTSRPRFRIIGGEIIVGELLYASPIAAPEPATNPMCEFKTNDIMQRKAYRKTGYVLQSDDPAERICVSDGGAVSWFTREQWHWLMHNRDHVEFAWPKPIGAEVPATKEKTK